jgi:hypothetical protein
MGSRIYVDFGRLEYKKACELVLKEITLQRESRIANEASNEKGTNGDATHSMRQTTLDSTETLTLTTKEKIDESNLPEQYIKRNTTKSNYRSIAIEKWAKQDVLDFLYDSNLHYMMPLCEVMTGSGLIKLFQMCQTKPNRFYVQLNEELVSRFDGLHLPIGIYTQFISEMDQLVNSSSSSSSTPVRETDHSKHSSSSESSTPSPANVKQITKKPSTTLTVEPPTQSTVYRTSVPNLKTVQTRNVQITEQTAYETTPPDILRSLQHPSTVDPVQIGSYEPVLTAYQTAPHNILRSSQNLPTMGSGQIGPYKSGLTFIDEQTRQNQQINNIPYRRASFTRETKEAENIIYP